MSYNGYEEYKLDMKVGGSLSLDFKKLCKENPAAAYKRLRARLNLFHKKNKGQLLISRKDRESWKVTVHRVK